MAAKIKRTRCIGLKFPMGRPQALFVIQCGRSNHDPLRCGETTDANLNLSIHKNRIGRNMQMDGDLRSGAGDGVLVDLCAAVIA